MKPFKRILGIVSILAGIIAMAGVPMAQAQSAEPTPLDRGKALYEGHCASCHGITGDGNGLDATGMNPPPTNFRNGAINNLTDNDLEQAILGGKPNTEMKGYGTILKGPEVSDLIAYLRSLSTAP